MREETVPAWCVSGERSLNPTRDKRVLRLKSAGAISPLFWRRGSWLAGNQPGTGSRYKVFFPSALTFAHLALAAAESLALTAGLLRRSFFLAALTFAHLAFVAAIMAALPAALNRLLPFFAGFESVAGAPLILAHLARCAAAILARTAADLRRFFFGDSPVNGIGISPPPATIDSIWPSSVSICSLMAMMSLSWLVVKLVSLVMVDL